MRCRPPSAFVTLATLAVLGILQIFVPGLADAGLNRWTTNGPGGGQLQGLAIDPRAPATVYAAAGVAGVFKSLDAGGSWTAVNTGLTNLDVRALAIDPSAPTTLYAGTSGGGVFKTTNAGGTWTPMNTGLTVLAVSALIVDPITPANVYALTVTTNGATTTQVFKSTNGAGNWQGHQVTVGTQLQGLACLAIDPLTPTTLYVGLPDSSSVGVWKSTNGGVDWTQTSLAAGATALAISPTNPTTTVYAAGVNGIWESTDGGANWFNLISGNASALAIAPRPPMAAATMPTTLYAGLGGVLKSVDGGGSWFSINRGLISLDVSVLAVDPALPRRVHAGTSGAGVFDIVQTSVHGDFDADLRADFGVFRRSTAQWIMLLSGRQGNVVAPHWGAPASSGLGDTPVPADYDGDLIPDLAVYRAATGEWLISRSTSISFDGAIPFGAPAASGTGDRPVPADFDGDGKADLAIYRGATGQWFIFGSLTGFSQTTFGAPASSGAGDLPGPADFDGDGKADLEIYRVSTGQWFIFRSLTGFSQTTFGAPASSGAGDVPVPADYDGDGKADLAIYRASTGQWFIFRSALGFQSFAFGAPGDVPVPRDFDGDGIADAAVYRPSTGQWFILRSSDGGVTTMAWGAPGTDDIPLP